MKDGRSVPRPLFTAVHYRSVGSLSEHAHSIAPLTLASVEIRGQGRTEPICCPDRFRSLVKRLELPDEQQEQEEVVYRIIDNDLNTVEVTPAQYAIWRTQNDVSRRAVVGQDIVGDVMVRTTFSIMPENRDYKPYGTSAYALPLYDPLLDYFQRYDTWAAAEMGHRNTLDRIRNEAAESQAQAEADERISRVFSGTAAEVRENIAAQLHDLFPVRRTDDLTVIRTPLLRPDGSSIEVEVTTAGDGYELTEYGSERSGGGSLEGGALFGTLGVITVDGVLTCVVDEAGQLSSGVLRLAQAISASAAVSSRR